jgi:hypothetical protein
MSTPNKLRAKSDGITPSEVTKLKKLWRDSLAEDDRDYWRELFISPDCSQAEIRRQMFARLKVNLKHDSQLNKFRDWELEQRALDVEAERQEEDERRALAENPNWTLDEARESVLKKAYQRAGARGDFELGLAVVDRDLKSKVVKMDREKLELLKKKSDAYDRAQEALTKAKTSKGGITKETLAKIESELKLL